ncbi:murein hydrolase activator EnvC family protein [Luteimonas vadosa]|uniref:Peptidoglycan DD-metalloendopeptidase family protein n=1 Tax=Luteimonas vadosa TaxID=1165507 RepID=A0ABP9DRS1_9GAMM
MPHAPVRCLLVVAIAVLLAGPAGAQGSRDTERKLDRVKRELRDVAAERRKLEGQRGDASRQLRAADEQVGKTVRELKATEAELARKRDALAALRTRRDGLHATLAGQRLELAALLRAAYTVGDDAPLKLLLAQDRVAEANRTLAYHGYLQRARSRRIAELTAELAELESLEREIATEQSALDAALARQREQVAELERDRKARAATVAELDGRYKDRRAREQALGRDAKGLERLLRQLRAAAAKAEAERKAAAEAARRRAAAGSGAKAPPPVTVAKTAPIQVGGLGWPLSGSLLAGYGGRMPDGRKSSGVLIGAAAGTPVKAVADGTVVFSEWMTGYGMILIVDHGNGYMSLYAHNDALLKGAGDAVKRGDTLASVGNSGGQGRPGLYFELRRNGQPVDPKTWLQQR